MKARKKPPHIAALVPLILLLAGAPQDRDDLKRARAAFRKGEYETAGKIYERLSAAQPRAWDPVAGRVRVWLETGRPAEAARACEEFLKQSPEHRGARIALARTALEQDRAARTLELLQPLLDDVRARALAAQALESLDRVEEAARMAAPLVDLYNAKRDDYMKEELFAAAQGLAVYARNAGNSDVYKQVVQLVLPDILKADPGDAWVHAFLGRCLLDKYNTSGAARSFGEAIEANPACVPALAGQARLLLAAGRAAAALESCGRALDINPACEEARIVQAEAHISESRPKAALESVDQGLQARPDSVRLRSLRAAVRHLLGDAGYEEDLRRALASHPSSPRPYWEIARALILEGHRQFAEAQTFFKKALEQNAALPDLQIDYGMNCLRTGDEETGRKLLEAANAKDPFHVRVNNTVNLFQDFDKNFDLLTPPHYRVRLAKSERRWIEAPALAELDRAWKDMSARYGFTPAGPILVEIFPKHSDFSVRTAGVPGLGALGACFGRVVTTLSPRARQTADLPPFRWSEVLWHEMAHVFSLELSGYRVPSWLTEGLATYEEELGFKGGRRDAVLRILEARHRGELRGVSGLDSGQPARDPILTVYLQGARICAFIAEKHGFGAIVKLLRAYAAKKKTPEAFREVFGQTLEEFDREFFAWLDAGHARFRFRLPPTDDPSALLAEATAHPKDATRAARLAHALLASGKDKDAETWARRALEADPGHAEAHAALGQALFRRREREEAVPHLSRGTDDYQTWDTLGRCLAELERWTEAAEAFRKAIACFPAYLDDSPHRRLNDALLAVKDYDGALKAFEEMVAADPLDFRNRIKLARIYEERGAADLMLALLDQAAALEVRDLALLDLQASAFRLRGEHARATDRTLAALAILESPGAKDDPAGKADRYCRIGEDWLAQGRKDRALEYAREALKLVSGHERARRLHEEAEKP